MQAREIVTGIRSLAVVLLVLALLALPLYSGAQDGTQEMAAAAPVTPDPQGFATPTPAPGNAPPQTSPTPTPGQAGVSTPTPTPSPTEANLVNTEVAGESDDPPELPRQFKGVNEYQGPYFTVRAGMGALGDFAAYAQDPESKDQIALSPEFKLRDFRFLLRGTLPKFKRKVTWSTGIMYDGPTHAWLFRETGVMIAFPELWGNLFIGRTKEGFSLNKVMVGYAGWTLERSTMSDATIPILADGIKWLGYSPKHGFLWNMGAYIDWLSKGQAFSTYARQAVARFVWLPMHSDPKDKVFHMGVNLRIGTPKDEELTLKSRPEVFPAPFFINTGTFSATMTRMAGYEVYYRQGSWLFGSEYWWVNTSSPSTGNPVFHGGDVVATWVVTGESRPYNTVGGYFKEVSPPKRPVSEGGPGSWELVLRFSSSNFNEGTLNGGNFWRLTPMVNWYLAKELRWSFAYGYGQLNRFGLVGGTQFLQTRIQLWL
jgi:phosphate-selective porin OprO and OprP